MVGLYPNLNLGLKFFLVKITFKKLGTLTTCSADEDALILEKVRQNGAQASTWKELTELLNRSHPSVNLMCFLRHWHSTKNRPNKVFVSGKEFQLSVSGMARLVIDDKKITCSGTRSLLLWGKINFENLIYTLFNEQVWDFLNLALTVLLNKLWMIMCLVIANKKKLLTSP